MLLTKLITPTGSDAPVKLYSVDGRTFCSKPSTLLTYTRRKQLFPEKFETPKLSEREKGWLDMVELPTGYDVRNAIRMGGA